MEGDDLLCKIDERYFEAEDKFNLDYLTDGLPSSITSEYLLDYKDRLEKLLLAVSRKASDLILNHQPTYIDELKRIAGLQKSITDSVQACTLGRDCLSFIKNGLARNGRAIVEHNKKRESLSRLLESLIAISELKNFIYEIRSLVDNQQDFSRAMQLCKDVKAMLTSFQEFRCTEDLESKLNYLLEYINTQSLCHFKEDYRASMDELKMFLENEVWDMVPVRSDFKLVQLKEFSFLRSANINFDQETCDTLPLDKISLSSDSDDESNNAELNKDSVEEEGELLEGDDVETRNDVSRKIGANDTSNCLIEQEVSDSMTSEAPQRHYLVKKFSGPVLTNSSLNVLRLFGRYIKMMSVLEPIAFDILKKIYCILEYYSSVVKRMDESHPKKMIAVDSLMYLADQVWNLQVYMESLIPAKHKPYLNDLFMQRNRIVEEFSRLQPGELSEFKDNFDEIKCLTSLSR